MLGKLRPRRPSAALVLAFLALCVALSGTAVGQSAVTSAQKLITGKQIKNRSVTGADIKTNSLSSAAIKDGSLLGTDFKLGELPAGAAGPRGDAGPQGPVGLQGQRGPDGQRGPQGVGPQGEPGADGERGPQGERGLQGLPGERGLQGERGPQGDRESPKSKGKKGTTGATGLQGPPGPVNQVVGAVLSNCTLQNPISGVTVTTNGTNGCTIRFPASRFTNTPILMLTPLNGSGGTRPPSSNSSRTRIGLRATRTHRPHPPSSTSSPVSRVSDRGEGAGPVPPRALADPGPTPSVAIDQAARLRRTRSRPQSAGPSRPSPS